MRTKCKLLSILLTLAMLAGFLPWAVLPALAATEVSAWTALEAALNAGGEVTLTQDITAVSTDTHLLVPADKTVTLDLNGHTIDYSASGDGLWLYDDEDNPDYFLGAIVVKEGGALTIQDTSEGANGTITGITGESAKQALVVYGSCTLQSGKVAGAVMVGDGQSHQTGSFTLSGGTMEDCSLTINDHTNFTMTGGSISGHDVSKVVKNSGTFTMSGGTISGTAVTDCVVDTSSAFIMSGGTVSGAGQYGGVRPSYPDCFHVSGAPVVSSVYLNATALVNVDGALTSGASIPVISQAKPTEHTPVVITSGLAKGGENAASYFSNRTDLTKMVKNASGELELQRTVAHTDWDDLQSLLSAGGTVTLGKNYTANSVDQTLTIPECVDIVLDLNGHTVDGSALDGKNIIELKQGDGNCSDSTTLTIKDSASGGKIICGTNRAVDINNTSEFHMTGGTIEGGATSIVSTLGTTALFYMTGGTIAGTLASPVADSCVVNLCADKFTMSGGTISGTGYDNVICNGGSAGLTSLLSGGTIKGTNVTNVLYLGQDSDFTVSGGTIDGSDATNAVYVDPYAGPSKIRFAVSGSPTINGKVALLTEEAGSVPLTVAGTTNVQFSTAGSSLTIKAGEGYTVESFSVNDESKSISAGERIEQSVSGSVTIAAKMKTPLTHSAVSVADIPARTYAGTALTPVVVTDLGRTLVEDTDYTVAYENNVSAGTATATVMGKGDYTGEVTKQFTINKASLTGTANDNTITYGDAPAGNGVSWSGFVNGETEIVLDGTLGYDYSYEQFGDVGVYTITPKGLTAGNYAISFVAGTLTVEQKEVGLSWNDTTFTYNGSAQAPTATATGLVNGDQIGVTVTGAQTDAGSYTATATLNGDKKGNYKLPAANTIAFTVYGAKGSWSSNKLTATVVLPADTSATLIAASYDQYGKMAGAKVIAIENGTAEYATDLTQTDSYTYKLMLVNSSTYAPLCAAWSN